MHHFLLSFRLLFEADTSMTEDSSSVSLDKRFQIAARHVECDADVIASKSDADLWLTGSSK